MSLQNSRNGRKFTDEEDKFIVEKLKNDLTFRDISKLWKTEFGYLRSKTSIENRVRRLSLEPSIYNSKLETDIDELKNKVSYAAVQHKYTIALKEIDELKKQLSVVIEVNKSKYKQIKINQTNIKEDGVACALFSDVHDGEVIEPSTVNELNRYNNEIAKDRCKNFFSGLLSKINLIGRGMHINKLILAILGDVISGYIHEELLENNDKSPTESVLEMRGILHSGIDFLLKETDLAITIPCCIGNHGRTTLKKRITTAHKNSFEWLLYKILERDYANNNRVNIIVENGYHTYIPVYDKFVIRFHHGDEVNYQGGVGGITIPVNKAIAQWNKSKTVTLDCLAHFHQFMDGGNFIANGAIVGFSSYSIKIKASYERPQQAFFVVDREGRKQWVTPIFVE